MKKKHQIAFATFEDARNNALKRNHDCIICKAKGRVKSTQRFFILHPKNFDFKLKRIATAEAYYSRRK